MTDLAMNPSQAALIAAVKDGDVATVQQLLTDDRTLVTAQVDGQVSPVMLATYYGHDAVAEAFIAAGAPIDIFAAAARGRSDDLKRLLNDDPSLITAYSLDGWTPLHLAAYFGQSDAVEAIIAQGADPNAKSTNGLQNMALHSAVSNDHVNVATLLLMHGAEVNIRQQEGWTPLHGAAHNGNAEMLNLLLSHGADATAQKDNGETPRETARAAGHSGIADVLAKWEKGP